jgi:hypothetical protein
MKAIQYDRHCMFLVLGAAILLIDAFVDSTPLLAFALMGGLHANAIVNALRYRAPVTPRKATFFVVLVAGLSVVTIFSPLLLSPVLSLRDTMKQDSWVLVCMAFASAFGATAYWLLIRLFWLRSLTLVSWTPAVVLYVAATTLSFVSHLSERYFFLIAAFAWWAAFSFALYCGDKPGRDSTAIPEDALQLE